MPDRLHLTIDPDPTDGRPSAAWISAARLLAFGLLASGGGLSRAGAAELAPHRAVYDLTLASTPSPDLKGGSGRIALSLARPDCATIAIDYRFVARFERADRTVVTDQRTVSVEDIAARRFSFTTKTFVDEALESVIRGSASSGDRSTRVEIEEPERQSFDLPLQLFPSAHTIDLIDKAMQGERIVETAFYDGDNEAGKNLRTTALISDAPPETAKAAGSEAPSEAGRMLHGLRRWRIAEAYYNSDSDAEGLPLYQTSYTLYENGVSDDVSIDTGDYAFSGALAELQLDAAAPCPQHH